MIIWAGIILITASSFILGEYFGIRWELRIDQLCDIRLGINLIAGELGYNLRTLEEACNIISPKLDEPVRGIFKAFGSRLSEGSSACEAWEQAISEKAKETYLASEDVDMLSSLGSIFECFNADGQEKNIEALNERIDEKAKRLGGEADKAKRLGRGFSVMAGLLLVVILL